MKRGDKVTVKDGSFTLTIAQGRLEPNDGSNLIALGTHTILAVECDLPTDRAGERNNTIIRSPHGIITFIQEGFLVPAAVNYCPGCGNAL